MKKTITTLWLCISMYAAQSQDFTLFVQAHIDPKMAIQGPYKGKVNDTNGGTLNAEFKAGIEWQKHLIGLSYETHHKIGYEKWAVFFDRKFNDKILIINARNFTTRVGAEAGMIIRHNPPEDYRPVTKDWPQFGINIGVYYNLTPQLQAGINFNAFRGEQHYREYQDNFFKEFRTDAMAGVKFNF